MPHMNYAQETAFWLVWREGGGAPVQRHEFYGNAQLEAKRLADKERGQTFYVLQAVEGHAAPAPQVRSWPIVTNTGLP